MTYVLHRALGDDIVITRGGRQVRLRLVAALRDSIFQGELLMSQATSFELFPEQEGYRLLLAETPPSEAAAVAGRHRGCACAISAPTPRHRSTSRRRSIASRTHICRRSRRSAVWVCCSARSGWPRCCCAMCSSGGVSWRLLGAVGYQRRHFLMMAAAENALLLTGGLVAGSAVCGDCDCAGRCRARRPNAVDSRRRLAHIRGVGGGPAVVPRG